MIKLTILLHQLEYIISLCENHLLTLITFLCHTIDRKKYLRHFLKETEIVQVEFNYMAVDLRKMGTLLKISRFNDYTVCRQYFDCFFNKKNQYKYSMQIQCKIIFQCKSI